MKPRAVWAVVPVKHFPSGKSRLSAVLDGAGRAALARSMCEHVLGVLLGCRELEGVLVVTDGADVAELARARGAAAIEEAPATMLGDKVDAAIAHAARLGAKAVLVVMSDLPRLRPDEVAATLALLDDGDVVIAPDRRDEGTNALALAPPDCLSTRFGRHDSFLRHREEAIRLGLRLRIQRSPGLALDVDTPEDLADLAGATSPGA